MENSATKQMIHLQRDDKGNKVVIQQPSTPTTLESWGDPQCLAAVVPGGKMPLALSHLTNSPAFEPWVDHPTSASAWENLAQASAIDEPAFEAPAGLAPAAGVVVQELDGRIWLVCPTNRFAGYEVTFPKGHQEKQTSLQATALIEAFEEAGLRVRLIRHLVDVRRTLTYTRYYLAERVGGTPSAMGWESQCVLLVPHKKLVELSLSAPDRKVISAL